MKARTATWVGLVGARALAAALTSAALGAGAADHLEAPGLTSPTDAGAFGAAPAFYPAFEGQLELEQGRYDSAAAFYRRALDDAPGWPVALAGLGRTEAAQGSLTDAAADLRRAVTVVPQLDYLAALGDVLAASGDQQGAQRQYATVALTGQLASLNRQLFNRQLVLFDADHGRDAARAVALARAEIAVRPDVYGWDALSWALLADGQASRAWSAARRALGQAGQDPRLLYHAGLAAAAGEPGRARVLRHRALAISPHFDPLQVPRAQATLAGLGSVAS
jgi:tetratricopeptide (TPR) repeat protein